MAITHKLRPYQVEVGRAVLDSVLRRKGLTFTVEIARQGGKNELSAQLETLLLTLFMGRGGYGIKCSPTFRPQTVTSILRLQERLNEAGYSGHWRMEHGYILRLGKAGMSFYSADASANVVGATAHFVLELDEAQDIDKDKYSKDFRPMGSSTNVTTVLYGTPWDDSTLLEEVKQHNLELERRDGVRRHFRYDWMDVARHNPDYQRYVEGEQERLGEDHPLFKTQYLLEPLHGGGNFLSAQQRVLMRGSHSRLHEPLGNGEIYVAGVDLAGEAEEGEDAALRRLRPRRDSTVVTIARMDFSRADAPVIGPVVEVVEHYWWTGRPHSQLLGQLATILGDVWRCRRVVVDATGVGAGVASFLVKMLGQDRVEPFQFTAQSKSRLGFGLLASVNSGRLRMYQGDGSPEFQEFWREVELGRSAYRANQTLNFYVDPRDGHDDFLMSLALAVDAADGYKPRAPRRARGRPTGLALARGVPS